ncbi:MAG: 50S ribosomal protein L24 [candidate division Zixibacteria bacterium]|nr:50S ribosomal protein L24 [candidate division Zixibacteria bacterium]
MRIKKGDNVKVVAGNDKGKIGKVLVVYPERNRVIVEGVNLIKRHTRPTTRNRKGGIIQKEAPISASNVMYYDTVNNHVCKIGMRKLADGKRVRINKKSGEVI